MLKVKNPKDKNKIKYKIINTKILIYKETKNQKYYNKIQKVKKGKERERETKRETKRERQTQTQNITKRVKAGEITETTGTMCSP